MSLIFIALLPYVNILTTKFSQITVALFPGRSNFKFWSLAVCKYRVEGLGDLVMRTQWHQVDRGRPHGGPCLTVIIPVLHRPIPGVVNDKWYWCCLAHSLASSPRTDIAKIGFDIPRPELSPCVYPLSTWHYQTWPISQAFPLHVWILQEIQDWRWKWPRNEAIGLTQQCQSIINPNPSVWHNNTATAAISF